MTGREWWAGLTWPPARPLLVVVVNGWILTNGDSHMVFISGPFLVALFLNG